MIVDEELCTIIMLPILLMSSRKEADGENLDA